MLARSALPTPVGGRFNKGSLVMTSSANAAADSPKQIFFFEQGKLMS